MLRYLIAAVLLSVCTALAPSGPLTPTGPVTPTGPEALEATPYGAGSDGRTWVCQTFGIFC